MKKSELRHLIREEISKVLNEDDPISRALVAKMGVETAKDYSKNIMRPKHIDIWFTDRGRYYKALVDGNKKDLSEVEKMLSILTGMNVSVRYMDETELNQMKDILNKKGIKFTWDDSFDAS
jgi:hypothetical protein